MESPLSLEPVLARHAHILASVEAFEALVSGDRPPRVEGLGFRRWSLTRDLMLHFARMEGQFYAPIMRNATGDVANRAGQASAETAALVSDFREHVGRWATFPGEEQWDTYRRSILWLAGRVRNRLEAEARDLVTMTRSLPEVDASRGPHQAYVADCWEIRELLFPSGATFGTA